MALDRWQLASFLRVVSENWHVLSTHNKTFLAIPAACAIDIDSGVLATFDMTRLMSPLWMEDGDFGTFERLLEAAHPLLYSDDRGIRTPFFFFDRALIRVHLSPLDRFNNYKCVFFEVESHENQYFF